MADTYWQTGTGFGVADDPVNVPGGAVIITQATYDGLVAAQQATINAAAVAQLNQRKADYTTVYAALRSMGMPQAAALIVAKAIGDTPAVDPELNVKAMTQQSAALTFAHTIAAATTVFEKITEVPDLTIQESGLYKITWQAFGQITMPAATGNSGTTVAAIGKNAAVVSGTETLLSNLVTGNTVAMPALGTRATGSGESFQSLVSGDVISLYGMRVLGATPGTHTIESGTNGRSRIGVERIRPA